MGERRRCKPVNLYSDGLESLCFVPFSALGKQNALEGVLHFSHEQTDIIANVATRYASGDFISLRRIEYVAQTAGSTGLSAIAEGRRSTGIHATGQATEADRTGSDQQAFAGSVQLRTRHVSILLLFLYSDT